MRLFAGLKEFASTIAKRRRRSERTLMKRAIDGDRKAYSELFERNAPRIGRMAYLLLHDLSSAEDAVQETFTRGLSALPTYRGDAQPGVWLYSIGLNVCREHLRRETVRERLASHDALERGKSRGRAARGILTSLMRRETSARLAIALGYLTDLQREAFVLHYVEELPYADVGRLLETSTVAARGLAHRAKQVLRSKLPANISIPHAT